MKTIVLEGWFDAFRKRDVSRLRLSEVFTHSSPFGVIEGRQAYLDLVAANEEAFFSPELQIQDVFECGDRLAVRYLVNGNPACDCFYLQGDEIAAIYSYYHYGEKPEF